MRKYVIGAVATGLTILLGVAVIIVRPAAASTSAGHTDATIVTVTPASVDGVHWSTGDTRLGGSSAFVLGPPPAPAPLGAGSLRMTSDSTPYGAPQAKAQMFTGDYVGTKLSDLSRLSYSEFKSSASTTSAATRVSLNVAVYLNGTSGFSTLVFEPYLQPGGVGALHADTWQSWSTLGSGIWWSTRTVTGSGGTIHAHTDLWTWDQINAAFPDAVIVGGLGFNIGSGWTGQFSGNGDALAVGVSSATTIYDFEPDASICKDGGWQTFTAYGFTNQGDCVSFIASGGEHANP